MAFYGKQKHCQKVFPLSLNLFVQHKMRCLCSACFAAACKLRGLANSTKICELVCNEPSCTDSVSDVHEQRGVHHVFLHEPLHLAPCVPLNRKKDLTSRITTSEVSEIITQTVDAIQFTLAAAFPLTYAYRTVYGTGRHSQKYAVLSNCRKLATMPQSLQTSQ